MMARILVIDDDPDIRRLLDRALRLDGHEGLFAASGAEGLELARREDPDLVLLEWSLPDRTGAEVCRSLKQAPGTREVPFVFVTSNGAEADRIRGFELGAADYVV